MTTATGIRSADRNSVLATLGDFIREISNPDDLAYAAAELLGRSLNVSRAGYGTVDTSAETITIVRDWNAPGILSLAGVLRFRDYGSYIEDLKRGETVICADAEKDPRVGDRAEALEAISARALVNMPISEADGVVALLYLNNAGPREWSPEWSSFAMLPSVRARPLSVAVLRRPCGRTKPGCFSWTHSTRRRPGPAMPTA
ncbi:GAF domain-containing protein [Bradyrhizobium sp. USDA 3686]